jgi:GTPase SAR1 family protein
MGRLNRESGEIHAKIVYYGPAGSGKTANARFIHGKLKREHRGELRVAYARKEKAGAYEFLPVELGSVRGFCTSIHVQTVPGGDAFADDRRQVLEGVDGVVFVADLRPERHEATVASLDELEAHLESYGRQLDDVLLVIQYNRRDEADESALEKLHARLGVKPEAHFEAIASEGTGVLQCLTTLSKSILSKLRREADEADAEAEAAAAEPQASSVEVDVDEPLPASEEHGFRVESSGPVKGDGRDLSIPLRLVEESTGRKIELSLRLTIDP